MPWCGKFFFDAGSLSEHMVVHTKDRQFICDICEQSFGIESNFRRHRKSHIPIERRFKCDQCSSKFLNSGHLKRHMRNHTSEKSFKCKLCERSFSENYNLKQHISTHGENRVSIRCEMGCDKAFISRGGYAAHMQTKHKTGDPEEYQCDKCDKTASSVQALKRHVLSSHVLEKIFKCDECDWSFKTGSKLKRHKTTHE